MLKVKLEVGQRLKSQSIVRNDDLSKKRLFPKTKKTKKTSIIVIWKIIVSAL